MYNYRWHLDFFYKYAEMERPYIYSELDGCDVRGYTNI